ncbi:hypothetical protein R1sor_000133 [Riccia sorocarpa]|uniref:Uncharacterized protein n=1 Tax=Riccia sorocarpa TaxID=122646 RepID=A0ABD3GU67_9MARC
MAHFPRDPAESHSMQWPDVNFRLPGSSILRPASLDSIAAQAFAEPAGFVRPATKYSLRRPIIPKIVRHFRIVQHWRENQKVRWEKGQIKINPVTQFALEDLEVSCSPEVRWGGRYDLLPFEEGTRQWEVANQCAKKFRKSHWSRLGGCFLFLRRGSKQVEIYGKTSLEPYFLSSDSDWRRVRSAKNNCASIVYVPDPFTMMSEDQRRIYCAAADSRTRCEFGPVGDALVEPIEKEDLEDPLDCIVVSSSQMESRSTPTSRLSDAFESIASQYEELGRDERGRSLCVIRQRGLSPDSSPTITECHVTNVGTVKSLPRQRPQWRAIGESSGKNDVGNDDTEFERPNRSILVNFTDGYAPLEALDRYELLLTSWMQAQSHFHDLLKHSSSESASSTEAELGRWEKWKAGTIFLQCFTEALFEALSTSLRTEVHDAILFLNKRRLGFRGLRPAELKHEVVLALSTLHFAPYNVSTFEKFFLERAIPSWDLWDRIEEIVGPVDLPLIFTDGGVTYEELKNNLLTSAFTTASELGSEETLELLYRSGKDWYSEKLVYEKEVSTYTVARPGSKNEHDKENDLILGAQQDMDSKWLEFQRYIICCWSMKEVRELCDVQRPLRVTVCPEDEFDSLRKSL